MTAPAKREPRERAFFHALAGDFLLGEVNYYVVGVKVILFNSITALPPPAPTFP